MERNCSKIREKTKRLEKREKKYETNAIHKKNYSNAVMARVRDNEL